MAEGVRFAEPHIGAIIDIVFVLGRELINSVLLARVRFAPKATELLHRRAMTRCATCGRNSIENLSPTTDIEISSSSIFGSIATDTSAATHSLFLHKLANSIDDAVLTTY